MGFHSLAAATGTSVSRAEKFLVELANLRLDPTAAVRVLDKFQEFFPPVLFDLEKINKIVRRPEWKAVSSTVERVFGTRLATGPSAVVFVLAHSYLRPAWDAPDPSTALWRVFHLRLLYKDLINPEAPALEPPPLNPFEFSLLYLMHNIGKALKCPNPDCVAPYFFLRRKGQKYCGATCSNEAQKEIKLKWWNEKGKQRREEKARKERKK